jgi:hypothetical protein
MMNFATNQAQDGAGAGFDLFRLSRSKQVADLSPNTIRAYHAEGLPLYKRGKSVFVSRSELDAFIRSKTKPEGGRNES